MPRRSKGARLYVREREGRGPVYVILSGTHEISTSCGLDDVAGANKALSEYLARTFRPDTRQRDLASINCAEVLTMYARDLPKDSPSRATIGYHIKALTPFWGVKTLADVKGSTCRKYTAQRTSGARSVKDSTARQELKTFQAAINHWHRESPLAAVPKVTLPEPGERRERVLERSEVAALLMACRRLSRKAIILHNGAKMRRDYMHVARFILIGIYTGTRHDAAIRLRWEPSLGHGHIELEKGVIFRRGVAERETSKRRPPVRIPARLAAHMARWRRIDGSSGPAIRIQGHSVGKMNRAWKAVVKAAGLGPDVTPHVLRHTCASWLLWQGMSIWDVAGVVGADASTIERVYGHHRRIDGPERKRA